MSFLANSRSYNQDINPLSSTKVSRYVLAWPGMANYSELQKKPCRKSIPLVHNHHSRYNQITSVPKWKAANAKYSLTITTNSLLPTRSSLRQLVITQFHPGLPLLNPPHRYTTTLQTLIPTTVHLSTPSRSTTRKQILQLLPPPRAHSAVISSSHLLHHSPCKLPTISHNPALAWSNLRGSTVSQTTTKI